MTNPVVEQLHRTVEFNASEAFRSVSTRGCYNEMTDWLTIVGLQDILVISMIRFRNRIDWLVEPPVAVRWVLFHGVCREMFG